MTNADYKTLTELLRGSDIEVRPGVPNKSVVAEGLRKVELEIMRDPTGNFYTTAEDAKGRTHGYMFRNWTTLIKALKEMA
jgi:hypothetical protein